MKGVHEGALQTLPLRVVETSVAWPAPGEHLLYPISPAYLKRPMCLAPFDDTEWALFDRLAQGRAGVERWVDGRRGRAWRSGLDGR